MSSSPSPSRRFDEARLRRYVADDSGRVHGWLTRLDADLIAAAGAAQTAMGVHGGVGEIGVHHGKLFILLCLLLHDGETAFCVDVFDRQDLNVDDSGAGNETVFRRNLERHADVEIAVFRKSSLDLTAAEIRETAGPVRLFSIDGGHTAEITANDLRIAADVLTDDGVMVVDDYFNPAWPGVSEAFHQVLPGTGLVPFAIGQAKILVCRAAHAAAYRDFLRRELSGRFLKETLFLDQPTLIFADLNPVAQRVRQSRLWRLARTTPVGRLALKLFR